MTTTDSDRPAASRPSRRTILAGAGLAVAAPTLASCGFSLNKGNTGPAVQLYGRAGSFGALAARRRLATGQSFAAVPVANWRFGAGQAAYMAAVTGAGTVLMATTPYTDNQLQPTAKTMEIEYFKPGTRTFGRVLIPTTTGRTVISGYGGTYGGGDIGDLQVLGSGADERVAFVSLAPYHGWNTQTYGQLPSFGALDVGANGTPYVDRQQLRTAAQMGGGTAVFPRVENGYTAGMQNSRGLNEMAQLPASGNLVVTQYFGSSKSSPQGGIVVLNQAGRVLASWQYPYATYRGRAVKCLVREVESDPTGRIGDERFTIICDAFDSDDRPVPFPIQEFRFDARSRRIIPLSAPVLASSDGTRMETAKYGRDGSLFVARTRPDGMTAADVAVYTKGQLAAHAPARSGWSTRQWGQVAKPTLFVARSAGTGLVRSMSLDPLTGAILVAGLNGDLLAIRGYAYGYRVSASLDLGLNSLVNRNYHAIGVRKGAVDAARRALWLPVPQLATGAYPRGSYPQLDQWLYRVDLSSFLGV